MMENRSAVKIIFVSFLFVVQVTHIFCQTPNDEIDRQQKAYQDSLHMDSIWKIYVYYGEKLGVELNGTEDIALLQAMTEWLGTPYKYAAHSKQGTDCSGFVYQVHKDIYNFTLNRSSYDMIHNVDKVAKEELQFGDIVFFKNSKRIFHVGLYIGNEKFIHAASSKMRGVSVNSLSENDYYTRYFYT